MPRLSILIPCPSGDEQFETTLVSVLQNRPDDCEILVIYPGQYNDPYDLQGEVDFVVSPCDASLLERINLGFERAAGEIVHVLQCGMEVEEGWTVAAMRRFDATAIAAVSPQLLSRQDPSSVTTGVGYTCGGLRRLCSRKNLAEIGRDPDLLGPTLQAGFYRRDAVRDVGGVDDNVGVTLADVDLALALLAAGYRTVHEPSSRVHGAQPRAIERDGFQEARRQERFFWKHPPMPTWHRSLLAHLLLVIAETAFPTPRPPRLRRLFGRLLGCVEAATRKTSAKQPGHPRVPRPHNAAAHSASASRDTILTTQRNAARIERHVA